MHIDDWIEILSSKYGYSKVGEYRYFVWSLFSHLSYGVLGGDIFDGDQRRSADRLSRSVQCVKDPLFAADCVFWSQQCGIVIGRDIHFGRSFEAFLQSQHRIFCKNQQKSISSKPFRGSKTAAGILR